MGKSFDTGSVCKGEQMNTGLEITTGATQIMAEGVCPACGGSELERFFEIQLPVNCIALCTTREAALQSPTARMELGFCVRCGAVSSAAFDAARLTYDPSYDNSLHFSPTFQKYSDGVARELIERYNLHSNSVIDVGCGNGEFCRSSVGWGTTVA